MRRRMIVAVTAFLGFGSFLSFLGADTFVVDTWELFPREEMDISQRIAHTSMETGLMDALFDTGHIFFNTFTLIEDDESYQEKHLNPFLMGQASGAEYLVRLRPSLDDNVLLWEFYHVDPVVLIGSGKITEEDSGAQAEIRNRWYNFGDLTAHRIFALMDAEKEN